MQTGGPSPAPVQPAPGSPITRRTVDAQNRPEARCMAASGNRPRSTFESTLAKGPLRERDGEACNRYGDGCQERVTKKVIDRSPDERSDIRVVASADAYPHIAALMRATAQNRASDYREIRRTTTAARMSGAKSGVSCRNGQIPTQSHRRRKILLHTDAGRSAINCSCRSCWRASRRISRGPERAAICDRCHRDLTGSPARDP